MNIARSYSGNADTSRVHVIRSSQPIKGGNYDTTSRDAFEPAVQNLEQLTQLVTHNAKQTLASQNVLTLPSRAQQSVTGDCAASFDGGT